MSSIARRLSRRLAQGPKVRYRGARGVPLPTFEALRSHCCKAGVTQKADGPVICIACGQPTAPVRTEVRIGVCAACGAYGLVLAESDTCTREFFEVAKDGRRRTVRTGRLLRERPRRCIQVAKRRAERAVAQAEQAA